MPEFLQQCGVAWSRSVCGTASGVMRAQVALIVAFSSSALLGLAYRIFLFTKVKVRRVCRPIKNRDTRSLNQVLVALALCAGAKDLLENEICISIKLVSSRKQLSAPKLPGIRLCWPWTSENTVDQHSRYMAPQTITDCGNFTLDLKQHGFCASPLFLQTLGPWFPKGNAKFTFIREHNFGPLSSSPVLFVFSPGEMLLTLSVVQEWLWHKECDSWNPCLSYTSVRSGSWSTDSSCSPLFVNLPHIFEWVLFHNPLQGAVIPIACTLFSTTSFPSLRLSINVLGHRALWTASLFCNDLLCLALLVQGVNGYLLDNCQLSSLPHDCVAYRTRLRDHLKAFAGVLS